MTEEKHGIENIWRVLSFLVEAGNVAEVMKTKEGWVGKAMAMAPLFDEVAALVRLDLKALPKEYKDMSAPEKADLVKRAADKYDIKNEVMEKSVEDGLALAIEVADCVGKVVEYAKSLKHDD